MHFGRRLFFDIAGVLCEGDLVVPGAVEAVSRLHARDILALPDELHPETEAEARVRMTALKIQATPRVAWSEAYRAVDASDPALQLQSDRAALQSRATRSRTLVRLQTKLAANPEDVAVRRAVMEGLLLSGQPNNAMGIFQQASEETSLAELQVVALLSRGRIDEALLLGRGQVPGLCERGPVACGPWLARQGWGAAAGQGLRDMLLERGEWSRTRDSRAQLARALAEVERIRGRKQQEVAAWKQATQLAPRDESIRASYVHALLEIGQIGTARSAMGPDSVELDRSIKAVQWVMRIDPSDESEETTRALQSALSLDHDQPIVLRAWAHHRIVTGNPDAALEALTPLMGQEPDSSLTDLYAWAAGEAGQPAKGMSALQSELRSTQDPRRWRELVDKLSSLLPLVAEAAKARGEPRRALGLYGLARALAPDSTATLLGLGGSYWATGDLENTRRAFASARELGPGHRQALFSLVAILKAMEREEEAMQVLMDSGYADYHSQLLELELQVALESRPAREALRGDRLDEAVELYLQLLRRYPNNPGLMHGLADAYISAGRYEEAADAYALAQRVQPNNPWLRLGSPPWPMVSWSEWEIPTTRDCSKRCSVPVSRSRAWRPISWQETASLRRPLRSIACSWRWTRDRRLWEGWRVCICVIGSIRWLKPSLRKHSICVRETRTSRWELWKS